MRLLELERLWATDRIDPTGHVHVEVVSKDERPIVGDFRARVCISGLNRVRPNHGTFLVELKNRAEPTTIRPLLDRASHVSSREPLLVSAFKIGLPAGQLLAERGISWLDASGNYHVRIGDSVFERTGLREPGRIPRSRRFVFAPKASRVVRLLLSFPRREWRTTEVAEELAVDPGYTSRTLTQLRDAGYVSRNTSWHLARPEAMLDDWAHSYRFERHDIETFFSLTPRVEARMNKILESAKRDGMKVAFSGAAAAGLWGAPSAVDEVVAYVEDAATRVALANVLGATREVEAPNLLLVVPDDRGVFMPLETRDDLPLVCRPQLYLDVLRSTRGRSLAPHLLEKMPWRS